MRVGQGPSLARGSLQEGWVVCRVLGGGRGGALLGTTTQSVAMGPSAGRWRQDSSCSSSGFVRQQLCARPLLQSREAAAPDNAHTPAPAPPRPRSASSWAAFRPRECSSTA